MPEPLGLGGQGEVLVRLRVDPLDLGQAEAQQLGLARPLGGVALEVVQLCGPGLPLGPQLPVPRELALVLRPGERVQRAPLVPRGPQPHLVGLAVHGDQRVGELGEHRHRYAPAAEEGARPPGRGHRAHRHETAVVVQLGARVAGPLGDRGTALEHEAPLGHRTRRPDAHHGGVGASAQDQREATEHHRLARAGLARDRGQPGRERHLGPLDHAEVLDPQLLDHPSAAGSSAQPFQPATGSENRDTRRSVNGAGLRRASRTGSGPRRTSTRLPTGRSVRR